MPDSPIIPELLKTLANKISATLLVLFIVATGIFVYEHYVYLSWDFSSFVSNARYWAGRSNFYDTIRPPLVPFVLFVLSPLGWPLAEYLYIVLVSALFLYSSVRIAKALGLGPELFYFVSLTPYVLALGLLNGSELLSLALLELFLAGIIEKRPRSALFLGLACLARYNFLIFAPLVLFEKPLKKILVEALIFFATFIPWFVYSFLKTGNFLTYIVDSYALNFTFRGYMSSGFNFLHLLAVVGFLFPLAVIGFAICLKKKYLMIFLAFAILAIYQYATTPFKDIRYIFPLALPIAILATQTLEKVRLRKESSFIAIALILAISTIGSLFVIQRLAGKNNNTLYREATADLTSLKSENCITLSNDWPLLNYYGITAMPAPKASLVHLRISQGYHFVMFFRSKDPSWIFDESFVASLPILKRSSAYIIIGDEKKCKPQKVYDKTYLDYMAQGVRDNYNYSINTNPCFILFKRIPFFEKTCNFMNLKGFQADLNRAAG